jgi:hypothetical protein
METSGSANERASSAVPDAPTERPTSARPRLGPWIVAALLSVSVHGIARSVDVRPPEPAPLRWIRAADRHPLRLTLALGFLLLGCVGRVDLPSRQSNT